MKKAFVLLFVLLLGSHAHAEEVIKVGHVDLQSALNESEVGKKAKAELEGMVKLRQAMIDEKIRIKDQRAEEFQKQATALSDKVRLEREEELRRIERDIKRLIDDSNAEMQKIQREKERDILKGLEGIISRLGKERGFTIILPSDVILFSEDGTDLTGDVIEMFNASTIGETREQEKE
jgi:outer membrane protein